MARKVKEGVLCKDRERGDGQREGGKFAGLGG